MKQARLTALAASDSRPGVTRSYVYGPIFGGLIEKDAFQPDNLISVDSEPQLLPMAARKRIDGFLAERPNFAVQARKQGLEGQFEAHPVAVSKDPAYVLFSRKSVSEEILAAFDLGLAKVRESGKLAEIEAKYLK